MSNEQELAEYVFISEVSDWGVSTTTATHEKMCELAEGWLTDNEGEHVSIEIFAESNSPYDDYRGLYQHSVIGMIPVTDEKVTTLIETAMAYAWEMV